MVIVSLTQLRPRELKTVQSMPPRHAKTTLLHVLSALSVPLVRVLCLARCLSVGLLSFRCVARAPRLNLACVGSVLYVTTVPRTPRAVPEIVCTCVGAVFRFRVGVCSKCTVRSQISDGRDKGGYHHIHSFSHQQASTTVRTT